MERLDADELRRHARKATLRQTIGDVPITKRRSKAGLRSRLAAHAHCWSVHDALHADCRVLSGESTGADQGSMELRLCVCEVKDENLLSMCGKRAIVLLGLALLPRVQQHFLNAPRDAELARDLIDRVLPLAVPPFVRAGGARPIEFLMDVLMLHHAWAGEQFEHPPRTANSLSSV